MTLHWRVLFYGALLLATAGRSAENLNPRVRTVILVYPATFVAEINATPTGDGVLTIKCVEDCKHSLSFHDAVDDHPISITPIDAEAPIYLATTWATATAFLTRVYRIDFNHIVFVMQTYSYHLPIYGVSKRGRFVVACQGNYWATCQNVTIYLTNHGVVRVPGFVKQR